MFAPDCFRFSVLQLDSAGNQIARIGRYGNADDVGKEGGPDIAFAWPAFISVADGTLYVCDPVNRRITVVRFDYAAGAEAKLP